jgi:hypothetical protein
MKKFSSSYFKKSNYKNLKKEQKKRKMRKNKRKGRKDKRPRFFNNLNGKLTRILRSPNKEEKNLEIEESKPDKKHPSEFEGGI